MILFRWRFYSISNKINEKVVVSYLLTFSQKKWTLLYKNLSDDWKLMTLDADFVVVAFLFVWGLVDFCLDLFFPSNQ